ncbi:hypothetical protein PUN28_004939 [Cardiocondyla obscurior]|uniref:Uncharacterized protein n=1 Tax=Cardiocondyla obscurior TaxID=286306 RepID=A0AAW2GFU9_9HYME
MQAAGMLRGTRAISLLVLLVPLIGNAYSSPIQYLPSIPGYIPVYIRYGDEPLQGINPELAEAFGETSNSSSQKTDHTLASESDNFKDDINALLEESKREHDYPLHVRAAESRSFASVNEQGNPDKPKLLTIYTLPDDNDRPRRRYRGRSRIKNSRKQPTSKVNPLSDEEKEELEKLAVEVEKEETKPNELYAPNPRYPGSRSKSTHGRHKPHDFTAPIKVQVPLDEALNLPKTPQSTDFSRSNSDVPKVEKKEPSFKEQPLAIWPGVFKVSPVDLPTDNETFKNSISEIDGKKPPTVKIDLLETPQNTNFWESSNDYNIAAPETDEEESPVKVQRPSTILSNVNKLSPIDLPNQNENNGNKKIKDCA